MTAAAILGAIAPIVVLAAVGVALRRFGVLKPGDSKVLNAVIVYAALPALIFNVVAKAPLAVSLLGATAIGWALALAGLAIGWGLSRLLGLPDRVAGGFIIAAAIGNTGYLGYPVVRALFGEGWLPTAIFFDVFGSIACMLTFGIAIAARYGDHDGPVRYLRELLTFPAVVAALAGLAFRFVPWPAPVSNAVMEWTGFAGTMAAPLIMVSLGASLDPKAFKGASISLVALSTVKLLVLPALAVGLAAAFGAGEATRVIALEAGMPSALLTLIVAQRFGLDEAYVAAAGLTTTVLCVVTVPVVQLLIG